MSIGTIKISRKIKTRPVPPSFGADETDIPLTHIGGEGGGASPPALPPSLKTFDKGLLSASRTFDRGLGDITFR